jgi:hypothetical protein
LIFAWRIPSDNLKSRQANYLLLSVIHITDEILESLLQSVSLSNLAFVWPDGSRGFYRLCDKNHDTVLTVVGIGPHGSSASGAPSSAIEQSSSRKYAVEGCILGVRTHEVKSNAICVTILK